MFSIKESIKFGWEKFKANAGISILATLFLIALGSFSWKDEKFYTGVLLLGLALMVLSVIVRIGYMKIFLRIHDGENPRFVEIFHEYKLFWKYLGVLILTCIVTVIGLILAIIPGIFWAIRFSFSPLIVVDAKIGPIKAMKESYAITKGSFWKLLGFWIIAILLNMLGIILLGVGLLVSIPIVVLANVYIYRELSKAKAGLATVSPQTV